MDQPFGAGPLGHFYQGHRVKILITGMTASQASRASNLRSQSFAGRMFDTLRTSGHSVFWEDPYVLTGPESYSHMDAILVGVAPITSLAANRTYGALHLIDTFYNDPRLSLFIDAPNPGQITASLRSIIRTPENLTKPFYQNRPDYQWASDRVVSIHLLQTVERLLNEEWPTTLYPSLPWGNSSLASQVPSQAYESFVGVNVDYASTFLYTPDVRPIQQSWMSDSKSSRWLDRATVGLRAPIDLMKINKGTADDEVGRRLNTAVGALISPQKNGETWWSPRYSQSLDHKVPVATEWRDSSRIGDAWGVLPTQIEDMSPKDRHELATAQLKQYMDALPWGSEARQLLDITLGLD